jgi:hypothetical protein
MNRDTDVPFGTDAEKIGAIRRDLPTTPLKHVGL